MSEVKQHLSGISYVGAFVSLLVLATISLLLSFLRIPGGIAVALAIAAVKAAVVLWIFMHLAEQRFTNRLTVIVAVAFVVLLVSLATADVGTRQTFPAAPQPTNEEQFYKR